MIFVKADDGDEIAVAAYRFSPDAEEFVVNLTLDNSSYGHAGDFDWITLSAQEARKLGRALLAAADGYDHQDDLLGTS